MVFEWFNAKRSMAVPISGPMIQLKAREFAKKIDVNSTFQGSNGWLEKFKRRHNVVQFTVVGEKTTVNETTVIDWKEKLHSITDGYAQIYIYNMDETGVFFRAILNKALAVKGSSGKQSKLRLTLVLCFNMIGQFTKPIVIGRAKRPHCFRNIKTDRLPVVWAYNRKAWMTSSIYTHFLTDLNKQMNTDKNE